MSSPVTVVVPTLNGERFLAETLDSVLQQSHPDVELVLSDDGSSDGTLDIAARYGGALRVVRGRGAGVSAARNRGAEGARGRYVAFLDQDDVWEPDLLATLVPRLEADPGLGAAYADSLVIDEVGRVRGRRSKYLPMRGGRIHAALLLGNFVPIETLVLPAEVFRRMGGFDERLRFVEDHDLCLRIARRTSIAYVERPLARYRVHGGNLSHQRLGLLEEWIELLERLLANPGDLAPEERPLVERELGRRRAHLSWKRLRVGDWNGSEAALLRPGPRCPPLLALRSRAAAALLRRLPPTLRRRLLALAPARRLYGVRHSGVEEEEARSDVQLRRLSGLG